MGYATASLLAIAFPTVAICAGERTISDCVIATKDSAPTVVPSVVINNCRSIRHTSNLVSVIPPTHDDRVLLGVLPQPVVRLAEVINDMLTTIGSSGSQDDRGRRVGVGGDPGAVVYKHDEREDERDDDDEAGVQGIDSLLGRLCGFGFLVDGCGLLCLGLADGGVNFGGDSTGDGCRVIVDLWNSRVEVGSQQPGEGHGGGDAANTD